jgi:hypothetical protein
VRIVDQIQNLDIIQLDVQILVDALQGPTDTDVVLQLDGDGMVRERLEKASTLNR